MYSVCRVFDFGPAFVEQNLHESGQVVMGRTWIMLVPLSIKPKAMQPTSGVEVGIS